MKETNFLKFFLVILFLSQNFFGQRFPPRTNDDEDFSKWVYLKRGELKRKAAEKAAVDEKRTFLAEINEKLSVPQTYHDKYAKFLKEDKTGLARILPDRNCDKGTIVNVQELERCGDLPQIKGAGSLYSFRLNEIPNYVSLKELQFYIGESDIHFVGGKFVVGKNFTQDIIAEIGRVNLEDINSKSDALKFLVKWKKSKNIVEFDEQKKLLEKGISSGGYLYSNAVEAKLDSTYVLRSIAYYNKKIPTAVFWNTDLLAAFQVVGLESDGSIVIIWKKLKQRDAPLLKSK